MESQEPALLLPRKAAAPPPPPPSLPTFLPPPPLSTPPEPCAPGSLARRARRSVKSGDLRVPGGWSVECPPGGHFPTSWGLARLLGVWESKEGGGHRNPQQIQIRGRLEYLCIDIPLFVAQSLSLTSSGQSWRLQAGGASRGAGAGKSCQGAVYLRIEKCTKDPLAPTHHYYHTATPRGAAWRKLRWLLGTVGSQSRQPHDESQITLLGN